MDQYVVSWGKIDGVIDMETVRNSKFSKGNFFFWRFGNLIDLASSLADLMDSN